MFFIISKILHFLISPLTWVFILLLWGVLSKNQRSKKKIFLTAIVLLYFFSNSFIVDEAFRFYEERDAKYSEITKTYDVAIVLGGFTSYDAEQELEGFHASIDRLLHGLKLYKTGKAKKIMLVSGSGSITKPNEKEALILKNYLLKIGIPEQDLIIESESRNTHENAVNTAKILNKSFQKGNFILITSGYHMPRAKRCFKKVGLPVAPFSVDQYAGKRKFVFDYLFIPNIEALKKWNILTHEWFGVISYKIVGYI